MNEQGKRIAGLLVAAAAMVQLLSGCSNKPPGCADAETVNTAKSLVHDQASRLLGSDLKDDEDGLIGPALSGAKVELVNILDDGYRSEGKKQTCHATMRITRADDVIEGPVAYSTQRTVDDKSNFVLTMEGSEQLAAGLASGIRLMARSNSGVGTWNGTYACGVASVPHHDETGPFTAPVQMNVTAATKFGNPSQVVLQRKTSDGGMEILTNEASGSFDLRGRGESPSGRSWGASFQLSRKGNDLNGTGVVRDESGQELRACTLSLQRGGSAPAQPAAALTGTYTGTGEGGQVTLVVGAASQDGRFPVQINTKGADGACGGGVSGVATFAGTQLSILAEADGNRCSAQATVGAKGIELEEGQGCMHFHGAACGFNASLIRSK